MKLSALALSYGLRRPIHRECPEVPGHAASANCEPWIGERLKERPEPRTESRHCTRHSNLEQKIGASSRHPMFCDLFIVG